MSFLNKKLSSLFLILVVGNIFPYNAIATGKHQHQQSHTEKDYAYKIIQDTIIKNGKIEVHNDTVFNPA